MPISGLAFEKKKNPLSRRIMRLFEDTRVAYLSAKQDPKSYGKDWEKMVNRLRNMYDDLDDLARDLKEVIHQKDLESSDAVNIESATASAIFNGIKELRYNSENVQDPFSKKYGEKVLETLMENKEILAVFIHWALRKDKKPLSDDFWEKYLPKGDQITGGHIGLDLPSKDIPSYIIEHYGNDKNSQGVKGKVKGALTLLKDIYVNYFSEAEWEQLLGLEISKSDEKEEKANIDFITPNKPMYRIFDIDDIEELRGFTGEWVVQEKYDGMRIQIHKIDNKVKIYSYNGKDITDKCPEQVKIMKAKKFGECILDAELLLFDGDKPLHRAKVVARIFKDKKSDFELKAHVFDILRHNEKDMTDEPLRERIQTLFQNYSIHSEELLQFPSKKDTRIADNLKDVENYAKEIMKIPTAEGVVLKDIESTYIKGARKNPKWIKWKKFVDLDLIVLDKKTTKDGLNSYTLGSGPLKLEEARKLESKKIDDRYYLNVGKALNTKVDVDIGKIVRVKVDEVKKNSKGQYRVYSAKVIEIPEVTEPDKLVTLEFLSSNGTMDNKYKAKAFKKSIVITDDIHGTAEVIIKTDFDGFTIYGFKDNNLMAKNALVDLDFLKEEIGELLKAKKGKLRVSIKNFIQNTPDNVANINEILEFVKENHNDLFQEVFNGDSKKLKNHLMNEANDISYSGNNEFSGMENVLEKEDNYKTPEQYRHGKFKLYLREDDNLSLTFLLDDVKFGWEIKIESIDDVFDLFGKAGKYPAQVQKTVSREKLVDEGDVKLGVQRHGYHEYFLNGDKFETKLHLRVVPLDEKKQWIAFSSFTKEPVEPKSDDGIWDIREDKNKDLSFTSLD
tara:strand:+ start:4149 stop:6677 length:2529 start_codon:yes stop_codon:yes gene_type:complete